MELDFYKLLKKAEYKDLDHSALNMLLDFCNSIDIYDYNINNIGKFNIEKNEILKEMFYILNIPYITSCEYEYSKTNIEKSMLDIAPYIYKILNTNDKYAESMVKLVLSLTLKFYENSFIIYKYNDNFIILYKYILELNKFIFSEIIDNIYGKFICDINKHIENIILKINKTIIFLNDEIREKIKKDIYNSEDVKMDVCCNYTHFLIHYRDILIRMKNNIKRKDENNV